MFLIISGLVIINNKNLYVLDKNDLQTFSSDYSNWAEQIYKNMQAITGQAIKMDWIPNTNKNIQPNQENITPEENISNESETQDLINWEIMFPEETK